MYASFLLLIAKKVGEKMNGGISTTKESEISQVTGANQAKVVSSLVLTSK